MKAVVKKEIKELMEQMTVREKIAQTLLIRQSDLLLRADKDYKEARRPEEAAQIMKECQFGGVWAHGNVDVNQMEGGLDKTFHFTTESYREWMKEIKAAAKYPVICANDICGKGGFEDLGDQCQGLIVGAADSQELSFSLGQTTAREHALAECNWIWYPMVDRPSNRTVEIVRPFAGEPDKLIKHANAYIQGMQSESVAACVKHFPGQDPYETRDSHVVTTLMGISLEEWEQDQGRVFKELIDAGVYTVMTSATAFPAVDGELINGRHVPSSLSEKVVTGLLKEKLGFDGVVITDDVNMGGYTSFYDHDNLYVELIKAGHDALLGVSIDAVDIVEKGVLDGRLSMERIDDACLRMLMLKDKLGLLNGQKKVLDYTVEEAKADAACVQREIAEKGLTLLRDNAGLLPVSKEKVKRVTIITYSHYEQFGEKLEILKKEFEKRGAKVVLRDKLESFTDAGEVAAQSDLIIYAGYISHHQPKGAPSLYGDVFWSLRYAFTEGKEKSLGVSFGYPFIHYNFMDDAPAFVNAYRLSEEIQKAFVAAVYGEIEFVGKAPLDMDLRK